MLAALEHHVFEEVGEAGAPLGLVRGPDVVVEIHGDHRDAGLPRKNHLQAVGEAELRGRDPRHAGGRRWPRGA